MSTSDPVRGGSGTGAPRLRRATRPLALILLGLAATAVLYAVLLRALWLPGSHALEIDLDMRETGVLVVYPHVGRGYAPGDARDQPIRPGRRTYRAEVPFETGALKIVVQARPESVAIERVRVSGRDFARGTPGRRDESRTVVFIDGLTALVGPVPGWVHGLCLLLAALALAGALGVGRVRAALGAAIARGTEPPALLSVRGVLVAAALAGVAVLALATSADVYTVLVKHIDNPPYWPISVFDPAIPGQLALVRAALAFIGFWLAARHVLRAGPTALPVLLLVAAVSALATNALGGIEHGLSVPLLESNSYLRDARDVHDWVGFLSSYTGRQLQLRVHSRTHPPGAVLVYLALHRTIGGAAAIAVVLGTAVPIATSAFFYGAARRFVDRPQALFATLLLASLPAVQIYTVSTLDALVCAVFTGVLYCALHPDPRIRHGGCVLGLAAAMFVSFGALFLLPVLVGHELHARRSLRGAAIMVIGVSAIYLALYLATGFDWIESFRIASHRENPAGFRLLVNPGDYLFTRLEGMTEILLFAGPAVTVLSVRGLAAARGEKRSLWALVLLGVLTLLAMFMAGTFKTGETARACLFFCPYLVLPLAVLAGGERGLDPPRQLDLVCLAMAQTVGMQLFGDYLW